MTADLELDRGRGVRTAAAAPSAGAGDNSGVSTPRPGIGSGKSRLNGIDVTRGLALLGMMAVHALSPFDEDYNPNWVSYIAAGHAAATFAVLAGVGLTLTTGRARVARVGGTATVASIAGRAAAIGAIGLALGFTDSAIAGVILAYYAVLFVLAIPLVFLRTRTLVLIGVVVGVMVPVLSQWLRPSLPVPTLENPTFEYLLTDPLGLLSELLITGIYPVLPWMSYICVGLVVGRLKLSSVKVARNLLLAGVAMAVTAMAASWVLLGPMGGRAALLLAGTGFTDPDADTVDDLLTFGASGTTPTTSWWWLASDASHTSTPLDLLGTIGVAVAVLGAMLLLGHLTRPLLRRVVDVVTAPLAAAGGMTLTLYTAHVLFMNSPLDEFDEMTGYLLQVVVLLLFALAWRLSVGRGPLEALVTATATRARDAAQRSIGTRSTAAGAPAITTAGGGRHRPAHDPAAAHFGTHPRPAARNRLAGIDLTRGLALLGMIAVHALFPYDEFDNPNWVNNLATGRAAATFAVLAGVGLSLAIGGRRASADRARVTVASIAGRAAAIGMVGLALGFVDSEIAELILVYYAVMFLLAIPLVFLRTRTLVVVGLFAAVVVPVSSQLIRPSLPVPQLLNPTFEYLWSDPFGLLSELLVTGIYPVLPWMSYICAGLVVGRLTLSSVRVAWNLLLAGAVLASAAIAASWALLGPMGGRDALLLAGTGFASPDADTVPDILTFGASGTTPTTSWWWLASNASHTGTPLDLLGTIGFAVALLGAMLLLGHVSQPFLRRAVAVVTAPLAAAGAMTLTLYTASVLFMNSELDQFGPTTGFVVQVAAALLFGLVWGRYVGRGPLESVIGWVVTKVQLLAQPEREPGVIDSVPAPPERQSGVIDRVVIPTARAAPSGPPVASHHDRPEPYG